MLYVSSSINDKSESVPDRMYDLFFENKSVVIWFCNLLIVVAIIALLKLFKILIQKLVSLNKNRELSEERKWDIYCIMKLNIHLKALFDLVLQFYILCLCAGECILLIFIEIVYSWSYLTIFGILILLWMLIYKYIILYKEAKDLIRREAIETYILSIFNDCRKLTLCVLFFIKYHCYILILTPILLQTASLIIFLLCNNIKQRSNKILWIINECWAIVFCSFSVFSFSCLESLSSFSAGAGIIMMVFFTIILGVEIAVISIQDILDIKT